MSATLRSVVVVGMAALWGSGCVVTTTGGTPGDGGPGKGDLRLTWSVGAGSCKDAGVTEVSVSVGDRSESFDCEAGGALLSLPAGGHEIEAFGLDADGFARYGGGDRAHVDAGGETGLHLTLAALPGTLGVTWYFENGRLCAANGAPDVRVTVFDTDDYVVVEGDFVCEDGGVEIVDLPAGDYGVVVEALDDEGVLGFSGMTPVTMEKGGMASIEVELVEE